MNNTISTLQVIHLVTSLLLDILACTLTASASNCTYSHLMLKWRYDNSATFFGPCWGLCHMQVGPGFIISQWNNYIYSFGFVEGRFVKHVPNDSVHSQISVVFLMCIWTPNTSRVSWQYLKFGGSADQITDYSVSIESYFVLLHMEWSLWKVKKYSNFSVNVVYMPTLKTLQKFEHVLCQLVHILHFCF
jgi:hypothetical protein